MEEPINIENGNPWLRAFAFIKILKENMPWDSWESGYNDIVTLSRYVCDALEYDEIYGTDVSIWSSRNNTEIWVNLIKSILSGTSQNAREEIYKTCKRVDFSQYTPDQYEDFLLDLFDGIKNKGERIRMPVLAAARIKAVFEEVCYKTTPSEYLLQFKAKSDARKGLDARKALIVFKGITPQSASRFLYDIKFDKNIIFLSDAVIRYMYWMQLVGNKEQSDEEYSPTFIDLCGRELKKYERIEQVFLDFAHKETLRPDLLNGAAWIISRTLSNQKNKSNIYYTS